MIVDPGGERCWPWRLFAYTLAVGALFGFAACRSEPPSRPVQNSSTTLRIGFGSVKGQATLSGLRQQLNLLEREALVVSSRDGRLLPALADRWTLSTDRLTWQIHLRENATFHDGSPVMASSVARFLTAQLPAYLGPPAEDIDAIAAISDHELEIKLKRPSTLVLEGLDLSIEHPDSKAGTGPYILKSDADPLELHANPAYHGGKPFIDRIVVKTYESTRAAWAELLRGDVDMIYEVDADALDSLQPSSAIKVFSRVRNYSYVLIFNLRRPSLVHSEVRRQLNAAIDRKTAVSEGLFGHGLLADSPIWPFHWAYDQTSPRLTFQPRRLDTHLVLNCLFADPALERLALSVQKQLATVGVELTLELLSIDDWYKRTSAGEFDVVLADALQGPMLFWPSQFWRSDAPFNWGHYKNADVDAAFDAIRSAATDDDYRGGVSTLQRALVDDPPAIFLAWSEKARAVSTRFDVIANPDRDILSTLGRWKPVSPQPD